MKKVRDDLLDETGQTAELGKRAGKDRSAGKLTYPSVAGLEASRLAGRRYIEQAEAALAELPASLARSSRPVLDDLRALSRYVIERSR